MPAQAGRGCWLAYGSALLALMPLMALSRLWTLTGVRSMHRQYIYHTSDSDTAMES